MYASMSKHPTPSSKRDEGRRGGKGEEQQHFFVAGNKLTSLFEVPCR